MTSAFYRLIFQAISGGFDVLWNHKYLQQYPQKPSAFLIWIIERGYPYYPLGFLGFASLVKGIRDLIAGIRLSVYSLLPRSWS